MSSRNVWTFSRYPSKQEGHLTRIVRFLLVGVVVALAAASSVSAGHPTAKEFAQGIGPRIVILPEQHYCQTRAIPRGTVYELVVPIKNEGRGIFSAPSADVTVRFVGGATRRGRLPILKAGETVNVRFRAPAACVTNNGCSFEIVVSNGLRAPAARREYARVSTSCVG